MNMPLYNPMVAYVATTPLDFSLLNQDEQPVLYISASDEGQILNLQIANYSQLEYVLPANPDGIVSDQLYHFELKFRPGTLDAKTDTRVIIPDLNWKVTYYHNSVDGTDSLFLLNVEEVHLAPQGTLELLLQNVFVSALGGARNTRVEFGYHNIVIIGTESEEPENSTLPDGSRTQNLQILHGASREQLPFDIRFLASNLVLNDNTTSNSLQVGIFCAANINSVPLSSDDDYGKSKFILQLETGDISTKNRTLTTTTHASDINMYINNSDLWNKSEPSSGENPQWGFELNNNNNELALDSNGSLTITIDGIVTDYDAGFTKLYVFYENIPGYADGMQVLGIEKSPLLYLSPCRVSIATNESSQSLNVGGSIGVSSGNLLFAGNGGVLSLNENHGIVFSTDQNNLEIREQGSIHLKAGYNTNGSTSTKLYIASNGNIGVGTTNPGAKLTLSGGRLQITDDDAPISGAGMEVGYNANSGGIIRAYDHNQNATKNLQIDAQSHKFTINNATRLQIDSRGRVGIGNINSPQAQLHVVGDTILNGSLQITSGSVVTGIPVIDFGKIRLYGTFDDISQDFSQTITFSQTVTKAEVCISEWDFTYRNGAQKIKQAAIDHDVAISDKSVTLSGTLVWREGDSSSKDNHTVDFDVTFLVIVVLNAVK